jgi:predicted short-subunit dehydrogenase-like oxidoreductase (DUF2520 family)
MRKARSVALVCAGATSRSEIAKLPHLAEQLGPVKSFSLRVASRAVNAMRAGYPVSTYEELDCADSIIISAPDSHTPHLITELGSARMRWKKKSVVLCNSTFESRHLGRMAEHGASIGSFNYVDGFAGKRFVVEGDDPAVRVVRRLLEHSGTKAIRIARGEKSNYLAGVAFVSPLITPMIAAAMHCFQQADISPSEAQLLVREMLERAVRSYFRLGRKSWGAENYPVLPSGVTSLDELSPKLTKYYRDLCMHACEWMAEG